MKFFTDDKVPLNLLRRYSYNQWRFYPEDVIPVRAADPNFVVAPEIRESLEKTARDGVFSYGPEGGTPEFKKAAADFVNKHKKIGCIKDNIHATSGVAQAMMMVAHTFLEPGDEAILFDPVDFLYFSIGNSRERK